MKSTKAGGAALEIVHAVDESIFRIRETTLIDRVRPSRRFLLEAERRLPRPSRWLPMRGSLEEQSCSVRIRCMPRTRSPPRRQGDADLLIVGSHDRRGIQRMLLGVLPRNCCARSRVSVLVVRATAEGLAWRKRAKAPRAGTWRRSPRLTALRAMRSIIVIAEFRTTDLGRAFHETREITGHELVADGLLHQADDQRSAACVQPM